MHIRYALRCLELPRRGVRDDEAQDQWYPCAGCDYRDELQQARESLERAQRWILNNWGDGPRDHACALCRPESDIIIDGFTCAAHEARTALRFTIDEKGALVQWPPSGGEHVSACWYRHGQLRHVGVGFALAPSGSPRQNDREFGQFVRWTG